MPGKCGTLWEKFKKFLRIFKNLHIFVRCGGRTCFKLKILEHREHAIVVVLGDIGHSPRMCYHALSLANHGVHVHLVGYRNSMPHKRIVSHPNISIVPMNPPPDRISKEWPAALSLLLKFVWIFFMLFYTLLVKTNRRVSLVVLQNPPGIPSMLVCYMVCFCFIVLSDIPF